MAPVQLRFLDDSARLKCRGAPLRVAEVNSVLRVPATTSRTTNCSSEPISAADPARFENRPRH